MYKIKCINQEHAGDCIAGVRMVKKSFTIHGLCVEGVFPVFEGIKVSLSKDVDTLYHQLGNTDYTFYHGTMREATKVLKQMIASNPSLKTSFTLEQLEDIAKEKERITGKVWHHYEELTTDGCPIMQLVDETQHSLVKHTGGSYTWNPKHLYK